MVKTARTRLQHFVFVVFLVLLTAACTEGVSSGQEISEQLSREYGIVVHRLDRENQLPNSVAYRISTGETAVKLGQIDHKRYQAYLGLLQKALLKYPASLIAKEIKAIYIGGPYQENGAIITGMYEKNSVYLFYNHDAGDNSPAFLEQSFHHEISSLLIKDYGFPAFDWLELNPEGFSYVINPVAIDEYMNSVKSYEANDKDLAQGLVSTYGRVNAENDINTYAELVFTQPAKMKKYVEAFPAVARKFQLLKKFYLSISPEFEDTFSSIDSYQSAN